MNGKNILFTGKPGCGKTTLIEKVIKRLKRPATGFFTREIRERGMRTGFSIETLDGKRGVLAHVDIKGQFRVGKYGVNIEDIDHIAVPSIEYENPGDIVVIDEIGKMECFSPLFRDALLKVLDSSRPLIGSIALKGNQFIESVKARRDVTLFYVTEANREELAEKRYL